MYSIVYVLTDNENLKYYNDLIISIYSLRKRNFSGNVYILMDLDTKDIIEKLKPHELENYKAEVVVVDIPEKYETKAKKSRFIKTSMRKWVKGDFLYIDTDTVIADELPEVISEYEIAQVPDVNSPFGEMSTRVQNYHIRLFNKCGYEPWKDDLLYFNSGVMWLKDTELVHKIFDGWHEKWMDYSENKGVMEDQPALNTTNREMGGVIQRLSDLYNVQVSGDPFPTKYIADAKIIHYIHNDPESTYILSTKQIDKSNIMDPIIQKVIEEPKIAFNPGTMLRVNRERENIMLSKQYYYLNRMYNAYPRLFKFREKYITCLLKVWKLIHKVIRKLSFTK